MASKKHDNAAIDASKTYEANDIRLKGIVGFAVGLFLLIVLTFGLMYVFMNVLHDYNKENKGGNNPLAMTEKERLPPEPRLQLAPGFGVESEHGWKNFELGAPQAEYRELHKQWLELWEYGQKDAATGVVRMMPIDEAKEKFLEQHVKAKSGTDAEAILNDSKMFVSDSGAGRRATEKRR